MRHMDVLRHADPFEENLLLCSAFFFFFALPVLASEATRGQFPSKSCVGQKNRGQDRQRDHFTSTIPLESITQTALLMAKEHCLE